MKVVYFSSAQIPSKTANSIHIMKMCNALVQNGCDVTLFACLEDQYTADDVLKYYDVKNTFSILPLKRSSLPFAGLRDGLYMARQALKIKPDIVLGRNLYACYFAALLRQKVFFEIHSPANESGFFKHLLFKQMIKRKSFQRLVLITYTLRQYYESHYKETENKILVLPDGADIVDLNKVSSPGIKKRDKVNIGYTGHLYPGKGMEIIAELVPRCPFAHFHIVGGRETDLVRWQHLENYGNITFHGYINHGEIKNYIAEFDIVLLPNQRHVGSNAGRDIGRWTSPLKLFEYMAMGKPIICSDLKVLRVVVQHNRNAILCNPDNIDEWVNAIRILQ